MARSAKSAAGGGKASAVGPAIPNGPAVAVVSAATIGMLAMALAVIASHTWPSMTALMMSIGRILPIVGPGANGPYAGHETVMLFSGLLSWLILHLLLRRRQIDGPGWLIANLCGIALATLLLWPPVYGLFALRP